MRRLMVSCERLMRRRGPAVSSRPRSMPIVIYVSLTYRSEVRYWTQTTLKGSCRTAQGASPGKKHASSHLRNPPRCDPEGVGQVRPAGERWRPGRPGYQPGNAEAACTALSGRTSGPDTIPRACALGFPAGPLRGPFRFPDLVRFLTACETIHPQCQVCPAASAKPVALPAPAKSAHRRQHSGLPRFSRDHGTGTEPCAGNLQRRAILVLRADIEPIGRHAPRVRPRTGLLCIFSSDQPATFDGICSGLKPRPMAAGS